MNESQEGIAGGVWESVLEEWHCSWCSFTDDDPDMVIDHENREHGGKKMRAQAGVLGLD